MSASGGSHDAGPSGQDGALAGQGEGQNNPIRNPDPVTRIETSLGKQGSVEFIDYFYDQEKGDTVNFEFTRTDGNVGRTAVFTVTRSPGSASNNVFDISQVIPEEEMDKFEFEKTVERGFCRVTLKKKKGFFALDLAQYFRRT